MAASASTAAVGGASVPVGGAQGSVGGTPVGGAQLRTLQQRRARQLELLEKFEKRLRSHKSQVRGKPNRRDTEKSLKLDFLYVQSV